MNKPIGFTINDVLQLLSIIGVLLTLISLATGQSTISAAFGSRQSISCKWNTKPELIAAIKAEGVAWNNYRLCALSADQSQNQCISSNCPSKSIPTGIVVGDGQCSGSSNSWSVKIDINVTCNSVAIYQCDNDNPKVATKSYNVTIKDSNINDMTVPNILVAGNLSTLSCEFSSMDSTSQIDWSSSPIINLGSGKQTHEQETGSRDCLYRVRNDLTVQITRNFHKAKISCKVRNSQNQANSKQLSVEYGVENQMDPTIDNTGEKVKFTCRKDGTDQKPIANPLDLQVVAKPLDGSSQDIKRSDKVRDTDAVLELNRPATGSVNYNISCIAIWAGHSGQPNGQAVSQAQFSVDSKPESTTAAATTGGAIGSSSTLPATGGGDKGWIIPVVIVVILIVLIIIVLIYCMCKRRRDEKSSRPEVDRQPAQPIQYTHQQPHLKVGDSYPNGVNGGYDPPSKTGSPASADMSPYSVQTPTAQTPAPGAPNSAGPYSSLGPKDSVIYTQPNFANKAGSRQPIIGPSEQLDLNELVHEQSRYSTVERR